MSSYILVDTNVILDTINYDERWSLWSIKTLENCSDKYQLAINPIIYAELSVGFEKIEDLEEALSLYEKLPLLYEAGFLAGKAFLNYRRDNLGQKTAPMPDFYIGAHAALLQIPLITRDIRRYQTYFPTLELIKPEVH